MSEIGLTQCQQQALFMEIGGSGEGMHLAARIDLAARLIEEEVKEELFPVLRDLRDRLQSALDVNALGEPISEAEAAMITAQMVEVADGIVDSVYVLMQLANTLQIPFDKCFAEVHRSNMSKFVVGGLSGKLMALKRTDGKIMKGPDYSPPDLLPMVALVVAGMLKFESEAA